MGIITWLIMELLSIFRIIPTCLYIFLISPIGTERKLYIAYMGYLLLGEWSPSLHHSQIFKQVVHPRKIIGARTFSFESTKPSTRDTDSHGTHIVSILVGNQVRHTKYYGLAPGIARGGVPSARLAIYKVCDPHCADIDTLSAFDQAIADGVDIISISLNSRYQKELAFDPVAIGAFHAIEKDILTVQYAGNSDPSLSSIKLYAPWVLSVGASDTDRKIADKLLLGNHTIMTPDVVVPGVEILAAFPPLGSPSGLDTNKKSVPFKILSGSSMACPHVTTTTTFIKSFHLEWYHSAIKSALMTTAWEMKASLNPEAEYAYGSGPQKPQILAWCMKPLSKTT